MVREIDHQSTLFAGLFSIFLQRYDLIRCCGNIRAIFIKSMNLEKCTVSHKRTSSKINLTVRRDSSKIIRRCRRGPSNSSSIYIYIHDVFCVKSAIRNLGNNLPNHFALPQRFILPSAVYNRGNLELDNSSYFVVVPGGSRELPVSKRGSCSTVS